MSGNSFYKAVAGHFSTLPSKDRFPDKGLSPHEHWVDAGYGSAELLVSSRVHYGIDLVGPARENPVWQTKVEGAYTGERFTIDRE
ncbi:hypothetical protein [Candidatus Methylobacter favarea]|uniref:hypothetical protein n=1 Tax=Candidatus Methylobacter favarea TaxID=2707345 RepID=UPI00157E1152|nr:hypothetical protein [Candidatus Methylobacter favarea]